MDEDKAQQQEPIKLTGEGKQAVPEDPWMHRSYGMKCRSCMFFLIKKSTVPAGVGAEHVGRCRRHAPTLSGYPVVFRGDWCGDHKLDENY